MSGKVTTEFTAATAAREWVARGRASADQGLNVLAEMVDAHVRELRLRENEFGMHEESAAQAMSAAKLAIDVEALERASRLAAEATGRMLRASVEMSAEASLLADLMRTMAARAQEIGAI